MLHSLLKLHCLTVYRVCADYQLKPVKNPLFYKGLKMFKTKHNFFLGVAAQAGKEVKIMGSPVSQLKQCM